MHSSHSDRRTQTRIQVQIPIEVTFPGVDNPVIAFNQDLSWSGALFTIPESLPTEADEVRLSFPWKPGERILAQARILRITPLENNHYLVATRFFSLSSSSHAKLEKLLNMLKSSEIDKPIRTSQIVRELEITSNEILELRQILTEISTGHLKVSVFDTYHANESISLLIAGTRNLSSIRLRARINGEPKVIGEYNKQIMHDIDLEFEHPLESLKSVIDFILGQLPSDNDMELNLAGVASEWLHTRRFAYLPRSLTGTDSDPIIPDLRSY